MRKSVLFAAAASALLLAACDERVQSGPQPLDQDLEIAFDAPGVTAYTRSIIEGTTLPTDQSFAVFGKKYSGDFTTWAAGEDYLFTTENIVEQGESLAVNKGVTVDYEAGPTSVSSGWRYSPTAYWPKDGSKLAFLAYAPADLSKYSYHRNSDIVSPSVSFTETGVAIQDFEICAIYTNPFSGEYLSDIPDPLYCDPIVDQTPVISPTSAKPQPVTVQFKHALSWLYFEGKLKAGSSNAVGLDRLNVYLADKGDFNQNLPTVSETESAPTWDNVGGASSFPFLGSGLEEIDSIRLVSTSIVPLGGMTVIPQYVSYQNIALRYTVFSAENPNGEQFQKTIGLVDALEGIERLEPGKKYKVTLVFDTSRDKIEFTPSVTEWETVEKTIEIYQ